MSSALVECFRLTVRRLNTRVKIVRLATSAHVPDTEFIVLPVMAIRFGPTLDENNAAPAGQAFLLPIRVQRQARAAAAKVRDLDLEVSCDDGACRPRVRTGNHGFALLFHPQPGRFRLAARLHDRQRRQLSATDDP